MADNTVTVADTQGLYKALRKVEDGLKDMRKAMREAGNIVLNKTRGGAPVETGRLKKAVKLKVKLTKDVTLVQVNAATPYSKVIEFGANPMGGERAAFGQIVEAQPFLAPAIASSESDVKGILEKALDDIGARFSKE